MIIAMTKRVSLMHYPKTGFVLAVILGLSISLSATLKPDTERGQELLPTRGEYQASPNWVNNTSDFDVVLSNLVGITPNSNFGGWTGDYFLEYYLPRDDGFINSIDFHFSDFPELSGGKISIWIYEAAYPWPEINTMEIADATLDAHLGYYDEADGFNPVGTNWIGGGINAVEGAIADKIYDPLGVQGWPAFGIHEISLEPNADDFGWVNYDLMQANDSVYSFKRDVPFIIVVKFSGFPDSEADDEHRMGFYSAVRHVEPQPSLKFYNTIFSPNGRTGNDDWGWYIRSYIWDWNVNVTLTRTPYLSIQTEVLLTTLSTADREVTAMISGQIPNSDGVQSASLYYTLDGGEAIEVAMAGSNVEYVGIIPGQPPGTEVSYWVEAIDFFDYLTIGNANTYWIYGASEPTLLVYDDVSFPAFYYMYNMPDTFQNHYDIWEPEFGPVTELLLSNYKIVYHAMGSGPESDAILLAPLYSSWLATGTETAPRRLFLSGQDYGIISGFADTTFPVDAFENMYLGVETLGPQDVVGFTNLDLQDEPYAINAVIGDVTTGFLQEYAGDSLQMYYQPAFETGFSNWIDNLIPSSGTVCITDPQMSDAAVAVYNSGPGWKTAFWALDPLAINYYSPVDTSSMYHWALTSAGNPVRDTFEWFGLPHNSIVGVENELAVPADYKLYECYPNPFNPSTTIRYELPKTSDLSMTIYDLLGRVIWTYEAIGQPSGSYELKWNGLNDHGRQVASGVYLISFSTPDFRTVQKAVLIR